MPTARCVAHRWAVCLPISIPTILCSEACETLWVAYKVLSGHRVTKLSRTMVGATDRNDRYSPSSLAHGLELQSPLDAQMLLDKTITAELLAYQGDISRMRIHIPSTV